MAALPLISLCSIAAILSVALALPPNDVRLQCTEVKVGNVNSQKVMHKVEVIPVKQLVMRIANPPVLGCGRKGIVARACDTKAPMVYVSADMTSTTVVRQDPYAHPAIVEISIFC